MSLIYPHYTDHVFSPIQHGYSGPELATSLTLFNTDMQDQKKGDGNPTAAYLYIYEHRRNRNNRGSVYMLSTLYDIKVLIHPLVTTHNLDLLLRIYTEPQTRVLQACTGGSGWKWMGGMVPPPLYPTIG